MISATLNAQSSGSKSPGSTLVIDQNTPIGAAPTDKEENESLESISDNESAGLVVGTPVVHEDEEEVIIDLSGFKNPVEYNRLEVNVFPMPASDRVRLEMTLPEQGTGALILQDLYGRVVMNQQLNWRSGSYEITANVSNLAPGHYIYRFEADFGIATGKLIKK